MDNAKCRKCRKFGAKLFLKGERCLSPHCAFIKRNYLPGASGPKARPPRKSEYGTQLFEKQKAKAEYGLRERQFANTFNKASKAKTTTGEELLRLLETRLDNVIYRLGWASSRAQARQVVLHGKIKINNRVASIPSMNVKPKDILEPKDKKNIQDIKAVVPAWLKQEGKQLKAEVERLPERTEIDSDLDEQLIIEFYSK